MRKSVIVLTIASVAFIFLLFFLVWFPFLAAPYEPMHHEIGLHHKVHECYGLSLKETAVFYKVFPAASFEFRLFGRHFAYSVPEVDKKLLSETNNYARRREINSYYCLGTHLFYGE